MMHKITHTTMDTIIVTPEDVKRWKSPPFQRPVKQNAKVLALAEELKINDGVWPGVVTLGLLGKDTYVIDGQHRKEGFLISGVKQGYLDVRIHHVESLAEMGDEFVKLNSQLSRMTPDDILRGLEAALPHLQCIRKTCPFVAYDSIRRNENKAVVSMSVVLRCWNGSGHEFPSTTGISSQAIAVALTDTETKELTGFLTMALTAFGRDRQYYRLWGSLNLTLTMWMYRRMCLGTMPSVKRSTHFTKELFQKCMMSLSAEPIYLDWLVGRNLTERDRSPAYARIKKIFNKRATEELGHVVKFLSPEWGE